MTFLDYNNSTYGFANIVVADMIKKVNENDLIYDLTDMGILLNRFIHKKCKEKLILWINPIKGKVNVERYGTSYFSGEQIIEDVEGLKISQHEIDLLLDFEKADFKRRNMTR